MLAGGRRRPRGSAGRTRTDPPPGCRAARHGGNPGKLAGQLGMASQTTATVIHRLKAAGHVERLKSRSDGRSTRLQVSAAPTSVGSSSGRR
ncbi:MarR family transcriptional regulator [Kribbella turkmenica]